MNARQHFEQAGKLKKPDGRALVLEIGRLLVYIRWGSSVWSTLTDGGYLRDDWLGFGKVEHTSGEWWVYLVIWRLSVRLAWL